MPWREPNEQREPSSLLEWQSREEEDKVKWSDLFQSFIDLSTSSSTSVYKKGGDVNDSHPRSVLIVLRYMLI